MMDSYHKEQDRQLPKLDVPEKYQPFEGITLDRNKPPKENYCNTCPSKIRGLCCYRHKNFIEGTNEVIYSNPCPYLNKAGRCKIYKKRFEINPNCMAIDKAIRFRALPPECKCYEVKTQMSFECNICKGVFEKELSEEEAEEQLKEEFPGWTTDQCDLICDDCYNKLFKKSGVKI